MHVAAQKAPLLASVLLAASYFGIEQLCVPESRASRYSVSVEIPRHVLRRARDSPGGSSSPKSFGDQKHLSSRLVKLLLGSGADARVVGYERNGTTASYARVDRILRLPNGACWTVLAYWREAA